MISAKGIAAYSATEKLKPYAFERRDPKDHDVLIDIMFCGVCHGDIHASRNDWGSANYPLVPGHEIAGVVRAIGSKVTKYKVGDHVGVGCFVDSCRECSLCHEGRENYCEKGVTLTYDSLERDGTTLTQGGYSNVIVVDENYVLKIPKSIPLDKAAPLLCAGITLYSPLVHWKAGPGKKVGIVGMGGLGHMGVKIARALGAEVTVFSRTDAKKEDALQMGANLYLATQDNKVFQKYAGYFDLIINTVSSSDLDMSAYLGLLKVDATFVAVGAPDKPLSIDPLSLIMKRTNFSGSANGSIRETQEMFDFCEKHNITPEIELIKPDEINEAFERVLKSDVRYRFVIDMKII